MSTPKKKPLVIDGAEPVEPAAAPLAIDGAEPVSEHDAIERQALKYGNANADALDVFEPPERRGLGTTKAESFGRGAQKVLGFGADDEGAGMVESIMDRLQRAGSAAVPGLIEAPVQYRSSRGVDAAHPEAGLDQRSAYEIGRDRARDAHTDAAEENPLSYAGGELTGAAVQSIPAMFSGGAALSLPARAWQSMKAGVPLAAAFGFNDSDADTLAGRAGDAVKAAELSAVASPILGEASHQVSKVGGKALDVVRRVLGSPASKSAPRNIRAEIRAAYDGLGGPRIQAADRLTQESPDASQLRKLAMAGGDETALRGHVDTLRSHLDELGRETLPTGPDLNDPKTQELAAAGLRRDIEALWPEHARALRGADDKEIERFAREAQRHVSQIWADSDLVKYHEDISSKGPLVAKLLRRDGVDPIEVVKEADAMAARLNITFGDLERFNAKGTPDRNIVDKMRKELSEYALGTPSSAAIPNVMKTDYDIAGEKFLALDQVKRELQRVLKAARDRRDSIIISELEGAEEQLRGYLEADGIWGRGAAALQQVRNSNWRDRLLLEAKDASPRRNFLTDASGKPSEDPYKPMLEGDPAGLVDVMKNVDEYTKSNEVATLRRWADREASLAEALTDHIDPTPGLVQAAKRARANAKALHKLMDTRLGDAQAARTLEHAGPKLSRDPQKLLAVVRNARDFGSADEVGALRAWAMEAAEQPYAPERERAAARNIMALLDREPEPPRADSLGLKLAGDPDALMALLRDGKEFSPELSQWMQNQAGNTARSRELVGKIHGIRDQRAREAAAARLLGSIGKPADAPQSKGVIASTLEDTPVIGPALRAMKDQPVDLQHQASELARLERVLELDPKNEAAQRALRRVFGEMAATRRAPVPRAGVASGIFGAPFTGEAVSQDRQR